MIDRAAMAVFEYTPTTGRRRLTDDTATAREIAEVVLDAADHWGAVEAAAAVVAAWDAYLADDDDDPAAAAWCALRDAVDALRDMGGQ